MHTGSLPGHHRAASTPRVATGSEARRLRQRFGGVKGAIAVTAWRTFLCVAMLRYSVQRMTGSKSDEISSLLSNNQRKWLRGDDDALGSPDRVVRSRVKQRVKQGITDLGVVFRSDRIDSDDLMKTVREETSTSSEDAQALASSGEMNEEMIADALDGALSQLEMASGEKVEDFDMGDIINQIRKVKGRHGQLDDETVLTFAVAGAMAGLMGTGKTEKQTRQWIEHHWPEPEEALEQMEQAKKYSRM